MLRIQRSANGNVAFTLSGQMDEEAIGELEKLINSEASGRRIVLDLKDVTLVNEEAVTFLGSSEKFVG
jgi:anti-anti-sigma regulatory factor